MSCDAWVAQGHQTNHNRYLFSAVECLIGQKCGPRYVCQKSGKFSAVDLLVILQFFWIEWVFYILLPMLSDVRASKTSLHTWTFYKMYKPSFNSEFHEIGKGLFWDLIERNVLLLLLKAMWIIAEIPGRRCTGLGKWRSYMETHLHTCPRKCPKTIYTLP